MEKTLIVAGLVIAFLCWITKRDGEYWNNKSSVITKRRTKILEKIDNDEALTVFEYLDYYVTKTVYGFLQYGMYGGLVLSLVGVSLFLFKPLTSNQSHYENRPVENIHANVQKTKVYSYSTEYKGLTVGRSTMADVVSVLGEPLYKINNSNNTNYKFGKVDVTIQDATGLINTIIIYDKDYVDVNGYMIGTSYNVIKNNLDVQGNKQVLIERSNGVVYWFKNQRVSRIVYGAQLKLKV